MLYNNTYENELNWLANKAIQSTLSKTDAFGTGVQCPSKSDVCLVESQIKGVKKVRDQL